MTSIFIYIIIAVLIEMLVSLAGIFFVFDQIKKYIHYFISFSVGTFLGVIFFNLLPETINLLSAEVGAMYILGGFLLFFILSRFLFWHHHHHHHETHDHDHIKISGSMILVADFFHNFIDGILIVVAFLVDPALGIITTVAVLLHEIPQEISDFFVLIHAGFSKKRALLMNFLISSSTLLGAVVAFFFLSGVENALGPILGIATGNFLYIAASDLLPEISHEQKNTKILMQIGVLLLGILLMYFISTLVIKI